MQNLVNSSVSTNSKQTIPTTPTQSYAAKTRRQITPLTDFCYPDEDQAIIFKHIESTKILDYLKALLPLIQEPKFIIAASRISRNRVVVFLDSADRVNTLMAKSSSFLLGNTTIPFHRLRSPAKKLVLSNVSPAIPNNILQNYLTNTLGLDLTSQLSILRVSPTDDLFAHVISYRRQVYYRSKSDQVIPPSFIIEYNNRSYRIFITHDEFTCFKCHKTGHKAEDCNVTVDMEDSSEWIDNSENNLFSDSAFPPLSPQPINTQSDTKHSANAPSGLLSDSSSQISYQNQFDSHLITDSSSKTSMPPPLLPAAISNQPETAKRRLSVSSTATSSSSQHQPDPKKSKEDTSDFNSKTLSSSISNPSDSDAELEDQNDTLMLLKQIFEQLEPHFQAKQNQYPLSFQNFCLFVDMAKGKTDISTLLRDLNLENKIQDLIKCLIESRSFVSHAATKARLTRLSKKLNGLLQSSINHTS